MFKRLILLGGISGIFAGLAAVIYQKVYTSSVGVDFSNLSKPVNIMGACILIGLVASIIFLLLAKWLKRSAAIVFNLIFAVLSFASIFFVFAAKLPLDTTSPELFPGLMIPIHFYPALAWLTLKPLFITDNQEMLTAGKV